MVHSSICPYLIFSFTPLIFSLTPLILVYLLGDLKARKLATTLEKALKILSDYAPRPFINVKPRFSK